MVGAEILYKIHRHLEEIKKTQIVDSRFGNVTIIAIGDLYQLSPFKDIKTYAIPGDENDPSPITLHGSLWVEIFSLMS